MANKQLFPLPIPGSASGPAGGDLSGAYPNPALAKIQGTVIGAPPSDATKFLNGVGGWTSPTGGGVSGGAWPFPTTPTTGAPPSAGWTWDNQGGSTIDQSNGFEDAVFATGSGVDILRLRYRTAPTAPYKLTAAYSRELADWAGTAGNGAAVGTFIGFRDSSGKVLIFQFDTNGAGVGYRIVTQKWPNGANDVTGVANYKAIANGTIQSRITHVTPLIFVRIEDDNTNLNFYFSITFGSSWILFDTRLRTDFFGSGPTQICYGAYVNGGKVRMAVPLWVTA